VRDLRVGFIRHFHEVDVAAEPEVTAALEHVARTLQMEGAEVRDVNLPSLGEFGAVNRVILQSEAWANPWPVAARAAGRLRPARPPPLDGGRLLRRRRLRAGPAPPARDDRGGREALREHDVLLCASSMDPPCRIDRPADIERTYPPARRARRSTSPAIRRSP